MISNNTFNDIIKKINHELVGAVHNNGDASPNQWIDYLSILTVSIFMGLSEKVRMPQEQAVELLISEFIAEIEHQKQFQLDNLNKDLR